MLEDHLFAVFPVQDESELVKTFDPSCKFLPIVQKDSHPKLLFSGLIEKIVLNI